MHSLPQFTIATVAVWLLSASATAAQTRHHVTRSPTELFATFVRERQSLSDQTGASIELTHVLLYHYEYPAQTVEYLLRELEQLARTGTPDWLRSEAVTRLASPGSKRAPKPMMGTYARLERIYQRSSEADVKRAVVDAMGALDDSQSACAFLERVATKESADFPGAAGLAVSSLVIQGDHGRTVLKRLYETEAVRDPRAKERLAILARRDYRLPEPKK